VQYWTLNFDRTLLANCTLSLKLRAHPRSGRYMTLFINDGFDPNCADPNFPSVCGGTTPGLQYSCGVNNTDKGYCYINIQTCFLLPNANRTFTVEVQSFNRPNLTVPDVPVEFAYSFTYDLVPSMSPVCDSCLFLLFLFYFILSFFLFVCFFVFYYLFIYLLFSLTFIRCLFSSCLRLYFFLSWLSFSGAVLISCFQFSSVP
jgi:hypothetical protein